NGAADVATMEAEGVALTRNPHGHVAPGRDRVLLQERRRSPDKRGMHAYTLCDPGQHLVHRDPAGRTRGVEHADGALFGHADDPFSQVADVNELYWIAPVAGRQDFAAAGQSLGPIGETVG